jgi:hypothetical protein
MLHGHPLSASLPEDPGFSERFWYWRGMSGQSYIHSIYSKESCPPVAGAVFVAVQKVGGVRKPVLVGRLPLRQEPESSVGTGHFLAIIPADEIHVHLLAQDGERVDCVLRDLLSAFEQEPEPVFEPSGFAAPVQLVLLAA